MIKKRFFASCAKVAFALAAVVMMSTAFTSCSKDNNDDNGGGGLPAPKAQTVTIDGEEKPILKAEYEDKANDNYILYLYLSADGKEKVEMELNKEQHMSGTSIDLRKKEDAHSGFYWSVDYYTAAGPRLIDTYAYSGSNVYGATKAFVRQFSMNLRAELADKNIRITNIEPGLCGDTEFSNVRFKGDDKRAAEVYENVEFIQPQDIADTALWLYQRPARMNVNSIEIMPVAQTFAGMKVYRDEPAPVKEETFEKQSMSLFGKIKSWFK